MRFPKVIPLFIGLSLVVLNAGDLPNSIRIHADQGAETISKHI